MAITTLDKADKETWPRSQKGGAQVASASLNLSASFQDLITWGGETGTWFPLGGAPSLSVDFLYTYSGGSALTAIVWVSNDSAFTIIHPAYTTVHATSTATDGIVTAYPASVTFPKGAISSGTGFDYGTPATGYYCGAVWSTEGYRYAKVQVKSNNASGSCIGYAAAGTNL